MENNKQNSHKKTIIIVFLSVIGLLLVAGATWFAINGFFKSENSQVDSSQNNTVSTASKNNDVSSTQSSTKTERPEKVTEIYFTEFKFQQTYKQTDYIQQIYYDSQSGLSLPYCLFIPENYNPSKKYPVILFLHGAGETGTDNSRQLNNLGKMFEFNGDIVANAFILCPQSNGWWNLDGSQSGDRNGSLGCAVRLLSKIQKDYSCDSNRIYVMGLSMGGYATWSLLEHYGYLFAAGVPICGGGNYYNGAAFKDIPIIIYHGTADTTVSFSNSERMYNAIVASGGQNVKFVQLQGVGHNAWDSAFSDRDMFGWMFAQNKSKVSNNQYESSPKFSIKDSSGKTIITDSDVVKTSYRRESNQADKMIIEFTLTATGRSKLSKAYSSSNGSPFTFYCGTQKVYSFTATTSLKENVFAIVDVFNLDNYYNFYTRIKKSKI